MKITANGTTLEYDRCAHCGALPDGDWLRKEIEFWLRLKCGVCGVAFKVTKLKVHHVKERDAEGKITERWVSQDVEREPWVHLSQELPSGCDLGERLHESCVTKAFPFGPKAESEKRAAEILSKKAKK